MPSVRHHYRHHTWRLTRVAATWRHVSACLCLLAVLLNALLIQPHFHWDQSVSHSSSSITPLAAKAQQANTVSVGTCLRTDTDSSCPWCQAMAQAGTYLTPAPATAPTLPPSTVLTTAAAPSGVCSSLPNVHWRSRAPPV